MKFYYIFIFLMASGLAISFVNVTLATTGYTTVDYMSAPTGAKYELTDFEGTFDNSTPTDETTLTTMGHYTAVSFLKDMAYNTFNVYESMVTIYQVPPPIAAILQVIVAVSWAIFFIQILSRFSWKGMEG